MRREEKYLVLSIHDKNSSTTPSYIRKARRLQIPERLDGKATKNRAIDFILKLVLVIVLHQEYCEEEYVRFMSIVVDTQAFKYLLETQDSPPLRPFREMLDKSRR